MSLLVISQLAEYPICSLSKKSTTHEVIYEDTITLNGIPKKRKWRAYSPTPLGSTTYQILINLIQLWDKESDTIYFSRKQLLTMMGQKGSAPKRKIIKDCLEALTSLKIETIVDDKITVFVLFQEVSFSNTKSYIMFSRSFHNLATRVFKNRPANQYYLDIELELFNKLTPIQQKLLIYLGKWLKHYKTIHRPLSIIYSAIPIGGSLRKKQKQTLKEAMKVLQGTGIFNHWEIEPPKKISGEEILCVSRDPLEKKVTFSNKISKTPSLKKVTITGSDPTEIDPDTSLIYIQSFVPISDYKKSVKWWRQVACRVSCSDVATAISLSKEHLQNLNVQKKHVQSHGAILTAQLKKMNSL